MKNDKPSIGVLLFILLVVLALFAIYKLDEHEQKLNDPVYNVEGTTTAFDGYLNFLIDEMRK